MDEEKFKELYYTRLVADLDTVTLKRINLILKHTLEINNTSELIEEQMGIDIKEEQTQQLIYYLDDFRTKLGASKERYKILIQNLIYAQDNGNSIVSLQVPLLEYSRAYQQFLRAIKRILSDWIKQSEIENYKAEQMFKTYAKIMKEDKMYEVLKPLLQKLYYKYLQDLTKKYGGTPGAKKFTGDIITIMNFERE